MEKEKSEIEVTRQREERKERQGVKRDEKSRKRCKRRDGGGWPEGTGKREEKTKEKQCKKKRKREEEKAKKAGKGDEKKREMDERGP